MKKILVVDDNRESLYMLEQFLAGNGMAVSTAGNGAEALQKAAAAPPDLIITDILMPVMDGYMLCRKLKSDVKLRHIPLIFYSATYTTPQDEAFALSIGAERFITKPQDLNALIQIINEVLQQKQEATPETERSLGEEMEFFRQYNEILFNKLEKKIADLHQVNQTLQEEIAGHEKANRKMFESEAKYRLLVENSSEVVFIAQEGIIKFINRAAINLLGSSYEELTSNPFTDFIHPDDREMVLANHLRRLRGEAVPNIYTFRIITPKGIVRWVEIHAAIVPWQGKPATLNFLTDITERRQAHEALQASEKKYRELYDFLPIPVYEMDFSGNIISANRAIYETFRGTEEDLKRGFKGWDLLSPEEVEKSRNNIQELLKGKLIAGTEYKLRRLDGSVFPAIVISRVIYDNDKPVGLRGAIVDITERQQAEAQREASLEALRQSEHQQRIITDNIQDMVWLMDMNLHITWVSRSVTQVIGFTPEELSQVSLNKLLLPESYELVQQLMLEHLTNDNLANKDKAIIVNNEFGYYGKNGDPHWGEMSISLLRDAAGEPSGFLGVGRDITKRRQMEKALQETQKQLHDAYRLAKIGSWSWNIRDKSIIWSEELYRMTGLNNHAMSFSDTKHPQIYTHESWERLKEAVSHSLKTGEPLQLELEIERPRGGNRCLNWLGGVIYDNEGNITGMHGTAQDITERKLIESELQKTNLELACACKELGEKQDLVIQQEKMASIGMLAAGIAHEIKNPLAIILQGVNFLQTAIKDNSLLLDVVERLNSAVLRADIIVKGLLSYSRQNPLELTKQNVPALIDESLVLTEHEFRKNNLQLIKEYAPDLPDICVDGNQIKQVFVNVLLNGINAMSAGGTFTIMVSQIEDDNKRKFLEIIFRDTGHGIPADKINNIFDPFFTTKPIGNTGLGLSISRGIIDRHDGTISAESEAGRGTSIIIRLPVKL